MSSLVVLIVNRSMHATSGTELYVRDLAIGLMRQNHRPVVFTPEPGSISDQLAAAGISVVSNVDDLKVRPDIVHCHHAWTTLAVLACFPEVPAIFVGHDASAWTDAPPRLSQIRRYLAVDYALFERFTRRHLIPERIVLVVPNAIDFSRIPQRQSLPEKPKRALLISNYSGPNERSEIQAACDARKIELKAVGRRFGNMTSRPEELYPQFDLVFAKGRSVLEAAASGAAAVYCDTLGCGPMLAGHVLNLGNGILAGRHLMAEPLGREALIDRIDSYDANEAAIVSARVRAEYDANHIVGKLVKIYRDVIAEHQQIRMSGNPEVSTRGMARELLRWSMQAEEVFRKHLQANAKLLPDENGTSPESAKWGNAFLNDLAIGQGWQAPEVDSVGGFCWIGPEPTAWLDLRVPPSGAKRLLCRVAHFMHMELLKKMEISINGKRVAKRIFRSNELIVLAIVPGEMGGTTLRVKFTLPKTICPSDMNSASSDHRKLGVAFRQIELKPAGFRLKNWLNQKQ